MTDRVLVVGGGLSGLAAAAFSAHYGASVVLVDRNPGNPAEAPVSARNERLNVRTMESLRTLGLDRQIRAAGFPPEDLGDMVRVDTLAGPETARRPQPWIRVPGDLSPVEPVVCGHDRVLRLLRSRAVELGVDVRGETDFLALREEFDEVSVTLRHRLTGRTETIRTSYVVGADGPHSMVRAAAGIEASGPGTVATQVGVRFRAELGDLVAGRRFAGIEIKSVGAILLSEGAADTWSLIRPSGPGAAPLDEADAADLVRAAAGRPDLAVEVLGGFAWPVTLRTAETFARGRVFLVGDAACSVPPVPGMNGNEVVQQGQNLAWKIAAVVHGDARPALLDSYDAERRRLSELNLADALARVGVMPPSADMPDRLAYELGAVYRSAAVIADVTGEARFADPASSSGMPGMRAPHLDIERGGKRMSTLDLFGRGPVLLAGADAAGWIAAAQESARRTGIGIEAFGAGIDFHDTAGRWSAVFGVGLDGAVLVRPDAVVGWRARGSSTDPGRELTDAVRRLFAVPGD